MSKSNTSLSTNYNGLQFMIFTIQFTLHFKKNQSVLPAMNEDEY